MPPSKPSPKTPLSAIAATRICNDALRDAGFPDIFFLFNDAGTDLAQSFVDDKRVALVSFTGSTKVGRMVGERIARRMGRSLLEPLGALISWATDHMGEVQTSRDAVSANA